MQGRFIFSSINHVINLSILLFIQKQLSDKELQNNQLQQNLDEVN